MTTGTMCVGFGFLNRIPNANAFIGCSFVIRIIEAFGNSAFLSSSFTMVAKVFPANVSTMFGVVEMAFGVGMIIGPTVGGILYQFGGYTLPFGVLGGILILQATLTIITLPRLKDSDSANTDSEDLGLMSAVRIPSVLLAGLSVFSGSIAVGALQATLERHLAIFSLSPMQVGMMFMLYGASYAVLNPFWGWMSDRVSSTLVILVGAILLGLGCLLVGPVPGLGLSPSYSLTVAAIIIAGKMKVLNLHRWMLMKLSQDLVSGPSWSPRSPRLRRRLSRPGSRITSPPTRSSQASGPQHLLWGLLLDRPLQVHFPEIRRIR